MPLATLANVEALLLRSLTPAETTHFAALVGMADAAILAECPGLTLDLTVDTDIDATVGRDSDIWSPRYPLVSVEAVTVEGVALDVDDDVSFDRWGAITIGTRSQRSAIYHKGFGSSWCSGAKAVIDYTAGYTTPPADLAMVAAELVAVSMSSPVAVRQEQLGDHSVTFGGSGARLSLNPSALAKVRRYRRQITSIAQARGGY